MSCLAPLVSVALCQAPSLIRAELVATQGARHVIDLLSVDGHHAARVRRRGRRPRRARLGGGVLAGAGWQSRRGVRAVRARACARRLARPLADHPPLVPHTRVRRADRRRLRGVAGRRGRRRRTDHHHHRRDRHLPAGGGDRSRRRTPTASTRSACRIELLDADGDQAPVAGVRARHHDRRRRRRRSTRPKQASCLPAPATAILQRLAASHGADLRR